jgi:hypothetical protein
MLYFVRPSLTIAYFLLSVSVHTIITFISRSNSKCCLFVMALMKRTFCHLVLLISTPCIMLTTGKQQQYTRCPASHRGGPGSRPDQSVWDLWYTKWRWDRVFSWVLRCSPVSIIQPSFSILIYHLADEQYVRQWLQFRDVVSPHNNKKIHKDHDVAQAVTVRPLTSEARIHARVTSCGICDVQSGTGIGFSLSSSLFLSQYHFTVSLRTHISGGWATGSLVAAVQRHNFTPSTRTATTVYSYLQIK